MRNKKSNTIKDQARVIYSKSRDTFAHKMTTLTVLATLVVVFCGLIFFARPQQAKAVIWATDIGTYTSTSIQMMFDRIFSPAITTATKTAVIQMLEEQVISYISGQNGEAAQFITNYREYLHEETEDYAFAIIEKYFDTTLQADVDPAVQDLVTSYFDTKISKAEETLSRYVEQVENWTAERDGWKATVAKFYPENNTYGVFFMALDQIGPEVERELEEKKVMAVANEGCKPQTDDSGNVTSPCFLAKAEAESAINAKYNELANSDSWFAAAMSAVISQAYQKILDQGIKQYDQIESDFTNYINNKVDQAFSN